MLSLSAQGPDYEQGVALLDKGQIESAIPLLERSVKEHPNDARPHKALGVAYAARNDYELAEPAFGRACELDAKLLDACYYHGRALYALNRFEASLAALKRAPASWRVSVGIAQALEGLGQAKDAETEFRKALELCRNTSPQPAIALSQFYIRQGRQTEAITPLLMILQHFPRSAEAHTHLGRILLDSNRLAEAILHLQQAVTLDPKSGQAHLLLANSLVKAGHPEDAVEHFQKAAQNAK